MVSYIANNIICAPLDSLRAVIHVANLAGKCVNVRSRCGQTCGGGRGCSPDCSGCCLGGLPAGCRCWTRLARTIPAQVAGRAVDIPSARRMNTAACPLADHSRIIAFIIIPETCSSQPGSAYIAKCENIVTVCVSACWCQRCRGQPCAGSGGWPRCCCACPYSGGRGPGCCGSQARWGNAPKNKFCKPCLAE